MDKAYLGISWRRPFRIGLLVARPRGSLPGSRYGLPEIEQTEDDTEHDEEETQRNRQHVLLTQGVGQKIPAMPR